MEALNLFLKQFFLLFIAVCFATLLGCADNEFSTAPGSIVNQSVNSGVVDILFVIDNSGSMSVEQERMQESFGNFVRGLDIDGLDFRIGIITTDVSDAPNYKRSYTGEPKGSFQDGNLLQFPNGSYYLTPDTADIEEQFKQTVQRPETLMCDAGEPEYCPTGDERGIYAANLTVAFNKKNFFREDSHIAIIFLSDEDVRGQGLDSYYEPELYDYPTSLIETIRSKMGDTKMMSFHAIVVQDDECLEEQNQGYDTYGRIGEFYLSLADPESFSMLEDKSTQKLGQIANGQMIEGYTGSICEDNYVSELGSIRNILNQDIDTIQLGCVVDPETFYATTPPGHTVTLNDDQRSVSVSPPISAGEVVDLSYECLSGS